jgi:ubiquinone/menaquinone biosynthesis C-methylase UbiE
MLVAAAAAEGYAGVGIDVSLVWLVVAQKQITDKGGQPVLAAAMAEALPLANDVLSGIISLDVIEHVGNTSQYLHEINRVVKPGGGVALTTPNRYSLTAEPHVFVWGVGWLPRRLQKSYVSWRSGKDYEYTTLLSYHELSSMLRKYTDLRFKIQPGTVSQDEIVKFPRMRARLARWYNFLLRFFLVRWIFLGVGPFFQIIGEKRE